MVDMRLLANGNEFVKIRQYEKYIQMKMFRINLGNFINNKSFQRAQGKMDMSYPHCYSLDGRHPFTTNLIIIK